MGKPFGRMLGVNATPAYPHVYYAISQYIDQSRSIPKSDRDVIPPSLQRNKWKGSVARRNKAVAEYALLLRLAVLMAAFPVQSELAIF